MKSKNPVSAAVAAAEELADQLLAKSGERV